MASASHSLWLGVLAAALAGGLLGLILAVFAIRYVVNQIVVGVVLDVFATGLTGYFYDRLLTGKYQNTLNSPGIFGNFRIPVLASIPIVGPVLFDSTVFLYLTYLIVIGVHVGLFRTRWGLRVRAVGEHPRAAETVGIRVLAVRYVNVVLGGLVAGIGGAYLDHRIGRAVRQGRIVGQGLHRPGRADLRPVDPDRCRRRVPAVRLRRRPAEHPVDPRYVDPLGLSADDAVHRHDHRRRRVGGPGATTEGRRRALCEVVSAGLVVGAEVAAALAEGRAVVALESTIITHGLPRPVNLELAGEFEAALRDSGRGACHRRGGQRCGDGRTVRSRAGPSG